MYFLFVTLNIVYVPRLREQYTMYMYTCSGPGVKVIDFWWPQPIYHWHVAMKSTSYVEDSTHLNMVLGFTCQFIIHLIYKCTLMLYKSLVCIVSIQLKNCRKWRKVPVWFNKITPTGILLYACTVKTVVRGHLSFWDNENVAL